MLTNNQSNKQNSFNIKPSDGIFRNIIIKSIGADNMTLLQQISEDDSIFFKVIPANSVEYKIYKALKSIKNKIPNMVKVYGSFGCVVKMKTYEKIKRKYEQKNGLKIDLKICETNTNAETNTDMSLKFIALENLTQQNYVRIDIFLSNKVLPNEIFSSIFIQGLYQLFNYYNTLGIIHGDCNDGNIMVSFDNSLRDEIIQYKIGTCPYRTYKDMWNYCEVFKYYNDKIINVKTYGMKLIIIDFDNSIILHSDYAITDITTNTTTNTTANNFQNLAKYNINPRINVFQDLRKYTTTMYKYAQPELKKKLEKFHKSAFFDILFDSYASVVTEYNTIPMDHIRNDSFLQKTSYLFQHYITHIIKTLNLPSEYILNNNTIA